MESHPDRPGVMEILSGRTTDSHRIMLTVAICVLVSLAIVATEAIFR